MSGKRIVGRRGKLMAQTSQTLVLFKALTVETDNKTFASGNPYWIEAEGDGYPEVRIDGLISGGSVNPTANNDEVQTEALSAYIGGVQVTAAADTSVTILRPSSGGSVRISAVVVDGSGAVTAVAGTEGTAGGARGAAGGPPFIPVGSLWLAEITLSSTAAAKVLAAEINTDVAERYDAPGYDVDFLDGKVVLATALDAVHTGTTVRKVWAQYKHAVLVDIGNIFDFQIGESAALLDSTAFGEDWMSEKEGVRQWTGSFNGYWVNGTWFNKASKVDGGIWVLKFYPDRKSAKHWLGRVHLDWGVNVAKDAMVTEAITFKGIGELKFKEA